MSHLDVAHGSLYTLPIVNLRKVVVRGHSGLKPGPTGLANVAVVMTAQQVTKQLQYVHIGFNGRDSW